MIRVANKNDIDTIIEMGNLLISNFAKTYDLESYLNDDKYIVLVNEDDKVNAFVIFLKTVACYELEMIYVNEKYRNKGIATNIFAYFKENYLKKGDIIFLEVAVNNEKAINLYKKWDFVIENIRKKYYNGIDAYIMKKVN